MKALIGVLILSGVFKSGHEDVESLLATDGTGRDIIRCTMPLKRFLFLINALRFDECETREERKKNDDKLAAISDIFQDFLANYQSNYSCSEHVTIDEKLVGFRDNWFSSMELVNELKKFDLTYVGTMRKNKREIPEEFLPRKDRKVRSSAFGFTKDVTLVSHVPKKNRNVVLVSTMHHERRVDNSKCYHIPWEAVP
ncbi:hypothetical protein ANN_17647 [Periplaneta americana]|uniref:PiggyBac transposable element-derived protein domain-containing protein n=1 Tax=Periplaneta americana TaxID=6978 RepID=A0ABQ8STN0_PERAM|nr:hypothetical protein ANN_17647 [Periplaneta americana]